jgi:hypothetical protein
VELDSGACQLGLADDRQLCATAEDR